MCSMYRSLLHTFLLIVAVVIISVVQANETQQEVEKRGQQTLADVIKQLNVMGKTLNGLKAEIHRIKSRRLFLLRGRDGRDGIPGQPGSQGPRGRDGNDGTRGPQGRNGTRGPPGQNGARGPPGPNGVRGPPGANGVRGPKGANGVRGPKGPNGARGPPGRNGGGVEYIRWGKTACPYGADKVYKGRVGGSSYTEPGGGSNYVCLPENPKYLSYKPGLQKGAYMYGAEYQVYRSNPFPNRNLHYHDAPCVVCHVKTRSAKLMIPATYQCPSGWTREYYGYLMAEAHYHKHATQFICVDKVPDVVPGSSRSSACVELYPVEGVCGALPCSPYVEGRELTCVLCTK